MTDQNSQQMQYLTTRFGGPTEITTIVQRLAAIFKVPEEDYTLYADVRGALYTASQWMWVYGATPIRHIHLIPFNRKDTRTNEHGKQVTFWRTTYAPADSYEWRRASAEIITAERRLRWTLQTAAIPDDKLEALMTRYGLVKTILGGPYNPEDIGYHARCFFFDQADECKKYSQPYDPAWHFGAWRRYGRKKTDSNGQDYYEPDQVPNGRTRLWVAIKRASKSALAEHFELRPIKGWEATDDQAKSRRINENIDLATEDPESEIVINVPSPQARVVEDDSGMMYAVN